MTNVQFYDTERNCVQELCHLLSSLLKSALLRPIVFMGHYLIMSA